MTTRTSARSTKSTSGPDGQLFLALAFYAGETLKKVDRGPLKVDEALDVAIQIAQGLVTAHAAGIVHRDIKPANVMVTRDGLVTVVDFGLAKLMGQASLTRTGTTLGTVAYGPLQLRRLFDDDREKVARLGRAAGSALRVYETLRDSVVISAPRAAERLGLTWPTVNAAIGRLVDLGIAREVTGRARDRLYAYEAQLNILNAGTEPLSGAARGIRT